MTVKELIEHLKTQRQDLPVVMWDEEADDWVEVVGGLWEDGTSHFALTANHDDLRPWPGPGDGRGS